MSLRKLLLHEKVEVRQLDKGLGGSWHPGIVVGVSESCRKVRYDELLCETGKSKLVESIPVTGAIEGLYQRPSVKSIYRGRIRPRPPPPEHCSVNSSLSFGACVDVLFKEAWWEGVIFDNDEGGAKRCVFFPDEGDERMFKLTDIRVTLEWDEFSGNWRERGIWALVSLAKEHKKEGHLFQLIKRVWSRLKVHYGFVKMISEWTCGAYCVWKEYFREVVCEITSTPRLKGPRFSNTPTMHAVKKRGYRSEGAQRSYRNASVLTRSTRKIKERESLTVRTRQMCLSEAENSLILTSDQCRQSQPLVASVCMNSEMSQASEDVNGGQIGESVVVKEGSQNDSARTRNSLFRENAAMSSKTIHCRRNWQKTDNELTTRKLKTSKTYGHKFDRCASRGSRGGSKVRTDVSDGASLQAQDCQSVDKRKELMLRRQKKSGCNVRYILRQKRRVTSTTRSIWKKRSSLRIKRMVPRKSEKANGKSKPIMQEELEATTVLQKEDDPLNSRHKGSLPGTTSCQESKPEDPIRSPQRKRGKGSRCRDSVCFICQHGGELLHCDHCMSSYHLACIDLQEVAVGESFCPSCTCGLCGLTSFASDSQRFTQVCYQCSRQYHMDCLNKAGISVSGDSFSDKFCSKSCFQICARLHKLLQISSPTTKEGFTWTITRSRRNDCNVHNERVHPLIQVSQVLSVLHECFEPIIEPHTGRDLVSDIVYNSGSKLRRLDFHGFYVMALLDGEELVCVATIRIHGQKVAEMPLIATRFKYRRKGMCRLLLNELEKMLVEMGVERLVLPGIAQLSDTWVSSFGFTEMPAPVKKELLAYPFVVFQGTTMFHKTLNRAESSRTNIARPLQANRAQDLDTRFSLHYKRKQKPNTRDIEDMAVTGGLDGSSSTYKLVYKRRRIQASRDSLDSS